MTRPLARAAALVLVLALLPASPAAAAGETPRAGGVLRVAMIGEPPTLDLHTTTAVIVQQIYYRFHHGLTKDARFATMPERIRDILAAAWSGAQSGKV